MTAKGLLLAMMEPSPSFEEEFQDWYDTEHVPERVRVPGFETAQRFTCLAGFPKYLACYDLSSLDVLRGPEYSSLRTQVSPWGQRVRARTLGRYRFTGSQIYPGMAKLGDSGPAIRLLLLRFIQVQVSQHAALLHALRQTFEGRTGVRQLRLFRSEPDDGDHIAMVELQLTGPSFEFDPAPFDALSKQMDCMNMYAPYWRNAQRVKE